jgi:serine/threonine-protein kinase HipA
MAKPPELDVFYNGENVARLRARNNGTRVAMKYSALAMDKWPINAPVLSCSLPIDDRWNDATAYFGGLLPEGPARDEMARVANVAASNTHALLARFGRDCAGALVIVAAGEDPSASPGGSDPYTPDELSAAVAALPDHPLDLQDNSNLSLPGVQDKLLLVRVDGGWARPVGGTASTHILKREDPRYPGLAAAEAACLRLAAHVGLTTVVPETVNDPVAGSYMIVNRFDRVIEPNGNVARVHQEDACQALAIATSLEPKRKNEYDGGPSFSQVADLLTVHSRRPEDQLLALTRQATFTVAIGNADAHGKNVSFFHHDDAVISLTPMYDTVPTIRWSPPLNTKAGMLVNATADINAIAHSDLVAEAKLWGVPEPNAAAAVTRLLEQMAEGLAHVGFGAELEETIAGRIASLRLS